MSHHGGAAGGLLREREVMSPGDLHAEREKIQREIEELEKSLDPGIMSVDLVSDSSLDSDSDDLDDDDSGAHSEMEVEKVGGSSNDDSDVDNSLPADPETCLQMNLVYQEVIQEKIEEVNLLIAQNREQQGPPANEETREKTAQGIKSFEELIVKKWKSKEKVLLKKSVISDRLQRLLQPKLLKLSYLNQKLEKAKSEMEKQILEKQIKEVEREIEEINHLPEEDLLGNTLDEHDWEKISNMNFDGSRKAKELRKFWQNWEHPNVNKREWSEEEIEKLKEIAAKHNCLDWQTIAQELGTNRGAFQCLQKFQAHNKDLKRKEWTKEEDQMLLQLVQEMRVGRHIPYKKISYYMEGRNSVQLIYRWSKSVDPNIRRGFWTPEEDAKLLAAVAKYGEHNWYKIRAEVPGRNDYQCRERYINALHHDVKKGKWSLEEEDQFIELTEKYGVGHWTKIASELPHRTASQCLSKWKVLIGAQKQKKSGPWKRLQKLRRGQRRSSSSLESSSEDSESELMDNFEGEMDPPSGFRCTVPSLDLWIPTRTYLTGHRKVKRMMPSTSCSESARVKQNLKQIPDATAGRGRDNVSDGPAGLSTVLKGIKCPPSTDINLKDPEELLNEASIKGKQVLKVTLEDVRRVLRKNTSSQRKRLDKPTKPSAPSSAVVSGVALATSVGQVLQGLQNTKEKKYHHQRERFQRKNLERRLLMAVTPWVGNVLLPFGFGAERVASRRTRADVIREQLQSVTQASTPVFTLFIQLFQIDTSGCMKVIRERRMRQSELIKAMAGNAKRLQRPNCSSQNSSGRSAQPHSQKGTQGGTAKAKRPIASKAKENPAAVEAGLPAPHIPKQKPKTVSELLREKRLRESRAKKALQRTVILAPQVLVSSSVIIQPPGQQGIPATQGGGEPHTAGLSGSRNAQPACASVPAFTPIVASVSFPKAIGSPSSPAPESVVSSCSSESRREKSKRKVSDDALGDEPKREASQDRPLGAGENEAPQSCKKAQVVGDGSAPVVLQNQAFMPHQITLVPSSAVSLNPATVESGPKKTSPSTRTICAPALVSSQQNAISLLPAIVAPRGGAQVVHKNIVPITWVVTPQGLIPTSVQAVVGVPSQGKLPSVGIVGSAAKSQSQTVETPGANTSVSKVPLTPAGASQPPVRCMDSQVLLAEGAPSGKTVCLNHPTRPSSIVLLAPGHSSPSLTLPAPASFSGLSGEKSVTEGSALHCSPMLLPQAKPPASTPRADLLHLAGLTKPGESSNCETRDGASSNPSVIAKGIPGQRPDQLPSCNNVAGTSAHLAAQVTRPRPICRRPPSNPPVAHPPELPAPSPEKNLIDVSLISLEDEASVQEWLRGKQGIPVPPLHFSLPYLPPFLCNLKTFSRLLLQKKTLEQCVSCLGASEESRKGRAGADLHAARELVRQKLGENPAYLLLKARFLAAFTLPAVLATLPPPRVTTTLSSDWLQSSESDEEELPPDTDLTVAGSHGKEMAEVSLDTVSGGEDADVANQGTGAEVMDAPSVPGPCAAEEAVSRRPKRSARFRKRRRRT